MVCYYCVVMSTLLIYNRSYTCFSMHMDSFCSYIKNFSCCKSSAIVCVKILLYINFSMYNCSFEPEL